MWSHVAIVVTTSQVRLYVNGAEAVHTTSPDSVVLESMKSAEFEAEKEEKYKILEARAKKVKEVLENDE